MSDVFFFKYGTNPLNGLKQLFSISRVLDSMTADSSVAVKLHMGEKGNIRYIRPALVRQVVDIIKKKGCKPFLFDTITAYPGGRENREKYLKTAAMNGFVQATVDAPIEVFDDGDKTEKILINPIEGCTLTEAMVPSFLLDEDFCVVLSHVKGHELAGFGGAIKNLGMGCVAKKTKQSEHMVNMPIMDGTKECDGCGECARKCPTDALSVVEGKIQKVVAECTSCGTCLFSCPSDCWVWPPDAKHRLQVNLAHAANAVFSGYKGKMIFVNFIQDVVPDCDCAPSEKLPVVQDSGIALSLDPVAVDKASLDLIDQSKVLPGYENFSSPDILGKMHETSSLIQLEIAEKLKMGSLTYKLIPI